MDYQLSTYGCKVNTYDSSLLRKQLLGKSFAKPVFILNTCAVTAEATREAAREARKIKRKNPDAFVVLTGCAAQVDTDFLQKETGADLIVANSHKASLAELIQSTLSGENREPVFKSNIFKKEDFEPGGGTESSKTRTFLKIQDGCNSFCTYCVIPFARGKSRSLSIPALRQRVVELHQMGFNEVVLTGVHIGDYEFGLANLVEDLLEKTSIPRLRLSSLEPLELTDHLLSLYQNDRLCPHFHMSIQSAETSVLKSMKRVYEAKDVEWALNIIAEKVPGAFVGMDVIVGFPGEGEEEFYETYRRLSQLPWTRIHVFPYSERPGTYALRLPQKVDRNLIFRRSERLRELSSERYEAEAQKQVGQVKKVMFLKEKAPQALSRDYWPVELAPGAPRSPGEEIEVTVRAIQPAPQSRMDGWLLAHPSGLTQGSNL